MAERSSASRTVSRTKCARCPGGARSCADGGNSQFWSISQGQKVFGIPEENHGSPIKASRYVDRLPGDGVGVIRCLYLEICTPGVAVRASTPYIRLVRLVWFGLLS